MSCVFIGVAIGRRSAKCLRTANGRDMMSPVDTSQDRLVIVGARSLDDLLELTARALDRLDPTDPLTLGLKGARAEVLASATVDPL